MAGTNIELDLLIEQNTDSLGKVIGEFWDEWSRKRDPKIAEIKELRDYIFATDTTTTSNQNLPWKNSTTLPKLCQLRDNLHANYISSIFPNDNWIKWEGKTTNDSTFKKKNAIQSYMATKAFQSNLRDTISSLLYDYIDTGNVFSTSSYVREETFDKNNPASKTTGYTGPKAKRISIFDIVFNPVAPEFGQSPKIIRSIKTIGELTRDSKTDDIWIDAIERTKTIRRGAAAFTTQDFHKSTGYLVDGFGDMREYYGTDYVEVLTFEGDFYNTETEEFEQDIQIIVIDKSILVTKRTIPSALGKGRIQHTGWRKRPDNLYAMGPLDNLVGMQYRIDHLENLKADAMDLMIHPPLVIVGDVDPWVWGPSAEIHITGEGSVTELGKNFNGVLAANSEIERLEQKMEEFAGAPKQAMGIRTPGEKTAFEVQALENAAGRIFQEKIVNFEVNTLEPLLNSMLSDAISAGDVSEVVRSFDEEIGAEDFLRVTQDDLMAEGLVRPIGARHFGQQAQILQNLSQALASPLGPLVQPHISGKAAARLLEDSLQLQKYSLIRPNVGLSEAAETQRLSQALQEEVDVGQATA